MFEGLLLKESLRDVSVLARLHVIKTETWQVANAAPGQPPVWTAIFFEESAEDADAIAAALSRALNAEGWYVNGHTTTHAYVIFAGKVFKYPRGDTAQRTVVREYGLLAGTPESQLDWQD